MTENLGVLIVDDERGIREELAYFFRQNGSRVWEAGDSSTALKLVANEQIDIAIVDIRLGGEDGLELLREIKSTREDVEVLMMTAFGEADTILEAFRAGAFDFFHKPFRIADVVASIERTKKYLRLRDRYQDARRECSALQQALESEVGQGFVSGSPVMREAIDLLTRVASSGDTTVLITGESGVGKELAARSVHLLSARSKERFCPLNCSAVPEQLFESELFGHIRGAFTGAERDRKGWFEIAGGGTLFLDEIGDMPLSIQAKLLRVLDEMKITPLGGRSSISVDVRIVAATNRNLDTMVAEGRFRGDLLHRLNRFPVNIPPLRERKEDILPLIQHYLAFFAKKFRKETPVLSDEARKRAISHLYPGNVRELRNLIERAVLLCDDGRIDAGFIPSYVTSENPDKDVPEPEELFDLVELERRTIVRAMKRTGGNKSQAARLLNISWFALNRRLQKLGLDSAG